MSFSGDESINADFLDPDLGATDEEQVVDVPRTAMPAEPPVPGAQWDEVHRRWEAWDEERQQWVVVGGDGDEVPPAEENPLPPLLAREVQHAEELESHLEHVPDVARRPEPPAHVEGAQWNEVEGRWERWDEPAGAWVPVEDLDADDDAGS